MLGDSVSEGSTRFDVTTAAKVMLFRMGADKHSVTPDEFVREMEGLRFYVNEAQHVLRHLFASGYAIQGELGDITLAPVRQLVAT